MQINLTAVRMNISDDKETVTFEHSQKSMIAAIIKQRLGFEA